MSAGLVSACIIARDEERVLQRCIESVGDACDEICVVDTGSSSDRMASIALRAGARVVRFTGCNDRRGRIVDFAMARNESLNLASGRWVLWIDADEVLDPAGCRIVREHAVTRDHVAVQVQLVNGHSRWPAVRLFRRMPSTRFTGIVHEWPIVTGRSVLDSRIVIRNLPNKAGKESSNDRDLRLCFLALRHDPSDPRMLLYMARALRRDGSFDRSIRYFQRYLEAASGFTAGRHYALYNIAVCHLLRRRWSKALRSALDAVHVDGDRAESHCALGDAYAALGRPAEAIEAYHEAMSCSPPSPSYPMFTNPIFAKDYPLEQLRLLKAT